MLSARPEDQILLCATRRTRDAATTAELLHLLQPELDWKYLTDVADRHSVLPLLLAALEAANSAAVPAAVLEKLRQTNRENTSSNFVLTAELFRLLDLFRAKELEVIPFKGPTLAMRAYGDPGLRQFGDLDILVRERDVSRVRELLIEKGYKPHQPLTGPQECALLRFDCACDFINQHGVVVDVHWGLVDRHHGFGIDTQTFFERLEPVLVNGRQLLTLSSENLLLFLCLHGFTHFWERLSWICDVAALVSTDREIDWNLLLESARAKGALRILLLGLWLSHDLLAASLPPLVLNAVQNDAVIQQIGSEVEQQLFADTRNTGGMFGEALLLLRLRERKRDQLKSVISLLWAPRRYDRMFVSFPKSFSFLYYLIRPARLAAKYSTQLFRNTKADDNLPGSAL
jgi:hypothetical protein